MEKVKIMLGSLQSGGTQISSDLTFLLVARGRVALKTPERQCTLEESEFSVLNCNEPFTVSPLSGANALLWLGISKDWLEFLCPQPEKCRYDCCSQQSTPSSTPLFDAIRRGLTQAAMLHYRNEDGAELLIQAELLHVMHILNRHFQAPHRPALWSGASEKLQSVLEYMNQNFRTPLTLEKTARQFYLSPAHMSRIFRKELGLTFLDYLISLRLNSARQELIYTDHSVTRIAMNYGFSSARALNQYFQRTYGSSPSQYRRKNIAQSSDDMQFLDAAPDGTLEALAKFLNTYEQRSATEPLRTVVNVARPGTALVLPKWIVDIGNLFQLLRKDVRTQLEEAQHAIGFQYVRLSGLFCPELEEVRLFHRFDCLELLEYLIRLGLTPMVQLDVDQDCPRMRPILTMLLARLGKEEMSRWNFELLGSTSSSPVMFCQAAGILRSFLPQTHIGLAVDPQRLPDWDASNERERLPLFFDFLTMSSDPNGHVFPQDATAFERFQRAWYPNQTALVEDWQYKLGRSAPIFLVNWNTLTGQSIVEAGEFHRTALIADALFLLRRKIAGYAVSLNLQEHKDTVSELLTYPLSLYLYQQIKRPLFFTLKGLSSMGREVLLERDGCVVTRIRPGRYIILLWSPCYIDPFQSLDNLHHDSYTQTLQCIVKGLEPGTYRLKSFLVDKNHGSTYRSWMKIDMNAHMDQDVLEYLSHASSPSVSLENRTITGDLEITQPMALNAVALWSIRRIETTDELITLPGI